MVRIVTQDLGESEPRAGAMFIAEARGQQSGECFHCAPVTWRRASWIRIPRKLGMTATHPRRSTAGVASGSRRRRYRGGSSSRVPRGRPVRARSRCGNEYER